MKFISLRSSYVGCVIMVVSWGSFYEGHFIKPCL